MKKFILLLMVCLMPFAINAQVKSNGNSTGSRNHNSYYEKGTEDRDVTKTLKEEVVVKSNEKPKEVKVETFRSVEQMPQFPGGEIALMKYLQSHINYPPTAAKYDIEGKVVVQFVVKKDGSIGEIKVVRSVPELDAEAIRVCRSLPNFIPGRQNGVPVNVLYTIPVTFKLQEIKQNENTSDKVAAVENLKRIVQDVYITLPSLLGEGTSLWDVKVDGDYLVITIDLIDNIESLRDLKQSEILNDISDIEFGDFIVHNKNEKIKKLVKPTLDAGMGIKLKFQAFKTNMDPAIFTIPYEALEVCYKFTQI